MKKERNIVHHGVVIRTDGKSVFIRVILKKSCDSCDSATLCSIPHFDKNIIEVKKTKNIFTTGEKVILIVSRFSVWAEQVLVYFFPPFLLISSFLLIKVTTGDFNLAGILALSLFAIYFILYYFLFKKQIESYLKYKIRKMD